ncbi:MAG: redoxin domain-containing protein [Pseudomonadota bacterium]
MRWRLLWALAPLGLIGLFLALSGAPAVAAKHTLIGKQLPEFSQQTSNDWLNSEPLQVEALRGQVVLIDFWAFGCWNCYRSFPWLNQLEEKFTGKPFRIIGVHSPEFSHEKDRAKLAEKIAEFKLKHPVMVDNDFVFWRAMHNKYWPSYYIIDKSGVIRGFYAGETHKGDSQDRRISSLISRLLKE